MHPDAAGISVLPSVSRSRTDGALGRLGLGRLTEPAAHAGRNENWSGRAESGTQVFVKLLIGSPEEAARRLRRTAGFQRLLDANPGAADALRTPRLLGVDEPGAVTVFEYVPGTVSAAELLLDDRFTLEDARTIGAILAGLHSLRVPQDFEPSLDDSPFPLPPLALLERMSLEAYLDASGGTLDAWAQFQRDEALAEGLARLRRREDAAAHVPCHGDFRLDQLLRTDDGWIVTDLEDFRLGDPARDLGSFAGEWLYRAVLGVRSPGPGAAGAVMMSHETIISNGVAAIERAQPYVRAFWSSYLAAWRAAGSAAGREPEQDGELAVRATAFAGWHLFDRVLAGAQHRNQISAYDRAVAGVGRGAILAPARFGAVIGLIGEAAGG